MRTKGASSANRTSTILQARRLHGEWVQAVAGCVLGRGAAAGA
ncbi:MAG TPA: hypothetical protein VGF16_09525 [Bryobacteraceae bacterium]